ncbi:LysE/ArgO family amino acid transporter [Rothia halotolerans]|uniref:LysE/ArgO family amino acid transporter n=1 Tax=Rothia halotolerans TaxID=405770 RepID=UPI00192D2A9B|nr:LysE/ArgO family amino acid transporter [Rothia halotolerans]
MVVELPLILMGAGTTLALIVAIGAQNAFILRQGIMGRAILPVIVFCTLSDALLYALGVSGMGFLVERAPWVLTALKWGGVAFLLGYGAMAARRAIRPSGETLVVPPRETGKDDDAEGRGHDVEGQHHDPQGNGADARPATTPAPGGREAARESVSPDATTGARATTGVLPRVEQPASAPAGASRGRGRELTKVLLTCAAITFLNPHTYLDTVVLVGSVANQQGEAGRWWFFLGSCTGSAAWFFALGYGARLLRPLFARPLTWRLLDGGIAVLMLCIAGSLALQ